MVRSMGSEGQTSTVVVIGWTASDQEAEMYGTGKRSTYYISHLLCVDAGRRRDATTSDFTTTETTVTAAARTAVITCRETYPRRTTVLSVSPPPPVRLNFAGHDAVHNRRRRRR